MARLHVRNPPLSKTRILSYRSSGDVRYQTPLEKNVEAHLAARSGARAKVAIAESRPETGKEGIWLELYPPS